MSRFHLASLRHWGKASFCTLNHSSQTFYQSSMQSQAMCPEINLAESSVLEYRKNWRPECCKYKYLYFFLYKFCSLWQRSNFHCVFTATSYKILEHELRQNNTIRWDPPTYPNNSTNQNRMQSFATWPAVSKQRPQDLSNGGFFYLGKHNDIKV